LKRSGKDWRLAFRLGKPVFDVLRKIISAPIPAEDAVCKAPGKVLALAMKKILLALGAASLCMLAVSCAPSTPSARIAERPLAFEKLSEKHKELVQRGEIDKGMDMSAVALAWGEPSNRVEGFDGKRRTERWEYTGSQPVVTNTFYGGYGYGYGRHGRYRYSGIGAGFGPEIAYIPYRKSTVLFIGGKVTEWERLK
jgi:hypothetical protein